MASQPKPLAPPRLVGGWSWEEGSPHPFGGPVQPRVGSGRLVGGMHRVSPAPPVKMSHSTSRSRATSFSFLQNFLCSGQLARWHATPQ